MKGIIHRYLIITIAGIFSLGLILTGIVQAQKQNAPKEKPAAEKKKKPAKDGEAVDRRRIPLKPAPNHSHPTTFLGIAATEVPASVRAHLDLPKGMGIAIAQVMPESPAAKADLKAHDVLTKLDDQLLVTPEQFQILVRMKKPGDKVKLTYLRAGKERTLDIGLDSRRVTSTETRPYPQREFRFNPHDPRFRERHYGGSDGWHQFQQEWGEKMRDWWEKNGDEISEQFRKAMNEAFENAEDLRRPHHPDAHRERQEREPRKKDKDPI